MFVAACVKVLRAFYKPGRPSRQDQEGVQEVDADTLYKYHLIKDNKPLRHTLSDRGSHADFGCARRNCSAMDKQ